LGPPLSLGVVSSEIKSEIKVVKGKKNNMAAANFVFRYVRKYSLFKFLVHVFFFSVLAINGLG